MLVSIVGAYDVVLAEVREMFPTTVREIVEQTGLAESTVRRALVCLKDQGLVESENYQRDARVWMPS